MVARRRGFPRSRALPVSVTAAFRFVIKLPVTLYKPAREERDERASGLREDRRKRRIIRRGKRRGDLVLRPIHPFRSQARSQISKFSEILMGL